MLHICVHEEHLSIFFSHSCWQTNDSGKMNITLRWQNQKKKMSKIICLFSSSFFVLFVSSSFLRFCFCSKTRLLPVHYNMKITETTKQSLTYLIQSISSKVHFKLTWHVKTPATDWLKRQKHENLNSQHTYMVKGQHQWYVYMIKYKMQLE